MKTIFFICLMLAKMAVQAQEASLNLKGSSTLVDSGRIVGVTNAKIITEIAILITVPVNGTSRDAIALHGCFTKEQWKWFVTYWREKNFGAANKIEVEIDSAKIKKVLTFEQAENFIVCR